MFGRHSCSGALPFADIEGNACLVTDADKKGLVFLANVLVQVVSGFIFGLTQNRLLTDC